MKGIGDVVPHSLATGPEGPELELDLGAHRKVLSGAQAGVTE